MEDDCTRCVEKRCIMKQLAYILAPIMTEMEMEKDRWLGNTFFFARTRSGETEKVKVQKWERCLGGVETKGRYSCFGQGKKERVGRESKVQHEIRPTSRIEG